MGDEFVPAQAIPPWEFIEDELNAREWTREDLARRMPGDEFHNLCALQFLEHVPHAITVGQYFAERLAVAFGTGAEVWLNIDASYRRALAAGR